MKIRLIMCFIVVALLVNDSSQQMDGLGGLVAPIVTSIMGGNRNGYNDQYGYNNNDQGGSSDSQDSGSSNFNRGGYSSYKQGGYQNYDNQRHQHQHRNNHQANRQGGGFSQGYGQTGYIGGFAG